MSRRARVTAAAMAAAATLTLVQCSPASPPDAAPTTGTTTTTTTTTTTPTTRPTPTTTAPPPPAVHPVTAEELGPSWRPGCPVTPNDLRRVDLDYVGVDGATHRGELIVHRDLVAQVIEIFAELRRQRFPIERMQNVTAYPDAEDELSMRDNNTSAFNCRGIPGSTRWSWHAYGRAVDVNPLWNPFVPRGDEVQPANADPFVDRAMRIPGMLNAGDDAVRAFTDRGWTWGGGWTDPIDYQHFEQP